MKNISLIDPLKLKQEGLFARTIIFTLVLLGIILGKYTQFAGFITLAGIIFWAVNHFFPLFRETRKLKLAIQNLIDEINLTIGISSLTLK